MHICFSCVRFRFSVLSQDQESAWDFGKNVYVFEMIFCVGWDVKPTKHSAK